MKNLKKWIICVACVLSLAFAGVANLMPNKANKAFASIEEATVVSTGANINTVIKSLQTQANVSFESIVYKPTDGFDMTDDTFEEAYNDAEYKKELVYEEMMIYLFVGEDNVLYYHGDDENLNGEVFLPEDCSGLFSGLSTVEYIDLSGFNSSFVSASSNMFDGCTALKEVTFGFNSTSLFAELETFWADDIYDKESGEVFDGEFELDEGDTITLIKEKEESLPELEPPVFNYRDGMGEGPVIVGDLNPKGNTGCVFYGWSTEIDSLEIVDKTKGTDAELYDHDDFEAGKKYYAVYKNGDKIVVTTGLNLTSMETMNKLETHGYSWNKATKVLNLNGLTMRGMAMDNSGVTAPSGTKVIINGNNVISYNEFYNSCFTCGDVEFYSESVEDILTINAQKAIKSTGNVVFNGGNVIITSSNNSLETEGNVIINSGKISVSSNLQSAINSESVSILGGEFIANGCAGKSAIEAQSVAFADAVVLKTGTTAGTAEFVGEYNGEEYLSVKFHKFTYSSQGNTIIATCSNEDCELEGNKISVSFTAQDVIYNGNQVSGNIYCYGTEFVTITGKSYNFEYEGVDGTEYTKSTTAPTNAGKYKVSVTVENVTVYVNFEIAKKEIVIDWCENDFTYNGLAQNVTATYEDVNSVDIALNVSLSAEFKNAGEYTATVSFKNGEENYKLPVVNTKTYNISKFKVTKPVADDTVFAYTGDALTYELAESEYYTISNNTKTEVGKYDVNVVLKDKSNIEWNDSTTDDLTFEFVINKVEFGAAEDAAGNPNNDVKIESIVGGIDPDAKLVIETVNVSNSAEKERLSEVLSLENNKEIVASIDIKFVLNSAEVQPDGKVVLKIKVPEAVGNKTFELFHVHVATSAEKLTYTLGQDGYIAVEVENFSEFVFVTAKDGPPVVTTPPAEDTRNLPFIFLGLLGGFAILFLLWFFILKRQKYDIISKIVVSIFETVAVVFLCKFRGTDAMTYVIVDLVAFVCVDIIYMINTARETKKEEQKSVPENINA